MTTITERLNLLPEWTVALLDQAIEACAAAHAIKTGELRQPILVAITCEPFWSPIDITQSLVGRNRTLARLDYPIILIEERAVASS